jgi:S-methylmethionine-dependent homocysteine/selenocysteine methylase
MDRTVEEKLQIAQAEHACIKLSWPEVCLALSALQAERDRGDKALAGLTSFHNEVLRQKQEEIAALRKRCESLETTVKALQSDDEESYRKIASLEAEKEKIQKLYEENIDVWQKKYLAKSEENAALKDALREFYEACYAADVDGELTERVTGEMLDKAHGLIEHFTPPEPSAKMVIDTDEHGQEFARPEPS